MLLVFSWVADEGLSFWSTVVARKLVALRDWSPVLCGCEFNSFYELSCCGSGQ